MSHFEGSNLINIASNLIWFNSDINWADAEELSNLVERIDFRVVEASSFTEVENKRRIYVDEIFRNWQHLRDILERHESTIASRWLRTMDNTQREEVLLTAWPDMAAQHRPDFVAFRSESITERKTQTRFREHFLWPHFNTEDLSKSMPLILLLRGRAYNNPEIFVATDASSCRLAMFSQAISPQYLDKYHMILTGRSTAMDYGELVAWQGNAPDSTRSVKGRDPGEGLLILEIQSNIYQFLVRCCLLILKEIPPEDLITKFPPSLLPKAFNQDPPTGFKSLATSVAEAPYRQPREMNLEWIQGLIDGKRAAAADHIWLLREDPGYFAEKISALKKHGRENLEDTNGRSHACSKAAFKDVFWEFVIRRHIINSYILYETWNDLYSQLQSVKEHRAKYEDQISVEGPLPAEYMNSLVMLSYFTNITSKRLLKELECVALSSPPLRRFFVRIPNESNSPTIQITRKPDIKSDAWQDYIIWLLTTLADDGRDLQILDTTNMIDELEHVVQQHPETRKLLSPLLKDIVFDLSLLCEILRQLNLYQPWASLFLATINDNISAIQKEYQEKILN